MLKKKDLQRSYKYYTQTAVNYFLRNGSNDSLYNYFAGITHGIGYALGYEHKRIESDIEEAIREEADKRAERSA